MNQRKVGVLLSYITIAIQSVIAIVYVPMLLHYLTQAQYGIYQLIGSTIAYLAIMEFGLGNATTRYLSQALAINDKYQIQKIVATSHTIYTVLAVILFFLGGIFYFFIDKIYSNSLSMQELHTAKQIYIIMLINMAGIIQSNIFKACIDAYERFIIVRGINLIKIILQPLLVWAILAWKASVLNLVLVQTVCIWIVIVVNYLYCKCKLNLSFSLQLSRTPLFKELTSFSIFIFIHMLMDQVYGCSGQLVLGAVSGPLAVATYSIAMQVVMFAMSIPTTMSSVFLPKLSISLIKHQNLNETNALFCKLGRLQFVLIMLLIIGFIFVGKVFINLWIGPNYKILYYLVLILLGGYVIDIIQNVGIAALQAMKKHAFRAYTYSVMAVINILLAILLSKKYGEIGCALSTAVCLIVGSGLVMNWYYYQVGIDIKTFFTNIGELLRPILLSVFCIIILFYLWPLSQTFLSFIMHGFALTIIYVFIMWLIGLNDYEKDLIRRPLCKFLLRK